MILILMTGCAKKEKIIKKEEKREQPVVSTKLENKKIDNLEIKNVNITSSDGLSVFTADVFNKGGEDINIDNIKIKLKDGNDIEIASLVGYIGGTIKSNESKQIISNFDSVINDVKSVEYEVEMID